LDESLPTRRKRLRMRAWHRGTREMDLILGTYADAVLEALDPAAADAFERLLEENDHDLYDWVCGRSRAPEDHAATIGLIRAYRGLE
jgi:antitoxin CptB